MGLAKLSSSNLQNTLSSCDLQAVLGFNLVEQVSVSVGGEIKCDKSDGERDWIS